MDRMLKWLSGYDLDAITFDLIGIFFIVLFKQYAAGGGMLAGAFPPVLAAALVDAAFLLVALKMNGLIKKARDAGEDGSGLAGIIISGAYALLTIAQPVMVTAMMRRFAILPDEPFMLVSFFIGNAMLFPALLVLDTEDKKEIYGYIVTAFAAGILFFGGLTIRPTAESFAVLALSACIIGAFMLMLHPRVAARLNALSKRVIEPVRGRYAARLAIAVISSFLLWAWWELAVDSITKADPGTTIGARLAILYFTGPLLYRLSIMVVPPLRPAAVIPGIIVLVASLLL